MHQTAIEETPLPEPHADEALSTISQLAKRYGVTLRALRFYEDKGLLKPHRVGAARLYDEAMRTRLETILEGKRLGFTLTEIRSMLANASDESTGCRLDLDPEQVREQIQLLEKQRAGLERAIEELRAVHDRLNAHPGVASAA